MNRYIIIGLIILITFVIIQQSKNTNREGFLDMPPVYWPLDYKYGQTDVGSIQSVDTNPNTLFTAHPKKLRCSWNQNEWTKHARIHHTGGIMYVSNMPPIEDPSCRQVTCRPLIRDSYTLKERDHFNPYPIRKDRFKCWECIGKY